MSRKRVRSQADLVLQKLYVVKLQDTPEFIGPKSVGDRLLKEWIGRRLVCRPPNRSTSLLSAAVPALPQTQQVKSVCKKFFIPSHSFELSAELGVEGNGCASEYFFPHQGSCQSQACPARCTRRIQGRSRRTFLSSTNPVTEDAVDPRPTSPALDQGTVLPVRERKRPRIESAGMGGAV